MKKLFTNLTFWVLTAITAGAVLGYVAPGTAVKMQILGTRFIDVVKLFINPIIFLTITLGISGMSSLKKRAEELNAVYKITSLTNEGTTVQLKFKIT